MEFETIIYSLIAVIVLSTIVYFIMQNRNISSGCNGDKCGAKNSHKCSGDVCSL